MTLLSLTSKMHPLSFRGILFKVVDVYVTRTNRTPPLFFQKDLCGDTAGPCSSVSGLLGYFLWDSYQSEQGSSERAGREPTSGASCSPALTSVILFFINHYLSRESRLKVHAVGQEHFVSYLYTFYIWDIHCCHWCYSWDLNCYFCSNTSSKCVHLLILIWMLFNTINKALIKPGLFFLSIGLVHFAYH